MVERTWVHRNRTDPDYERGGWDFVRSVAAGLGENAMIICPCIDCRNVDRHSADDVVDHLVTRGMDWSYKLREDWYHHGEVKSGTECRKNASQWNQEILGLFKAAEFIDEELVSQGDLNDVAEGDDKEEDEFLAKLADAETPLYPGCTNHSKLSAIVSLFRLKTQSGWSDRSFDLLLESLSHMLPKDNVLHTSLYEVKKFLKSFDMGYEKIHACVNDCCLFRNQFQELDTCPKCNSSRWKINTRTGQVKKGIPQKVLRYFPIIPRLKRMFRSEDMAKDLRWHFSNKSIDGKMRHPVDSVTWDQMNEKYPLFAAEERNIRLGLSTDGFNPFNMKNVNYSAWPVLLANYNMPPDKCMKEENIMLTLLIPGPTQPGNNIDVYLKPLIEDLNHLWEKRELTYDAFSHTTFTLRAMLLWTIQDFPAYGNLAGCKVKDKMGCPVCEKHTDSLWLSNCRKHVYISHRKSLSPTHVYRRKKAWFDGKSEHGRRGRILTGHNIYQILKNYKNDFGNVRVNRRKRKMNDCVGSASDTDDESIESEEEEEQVDEEELSRWKKRSILFKLAYWKEMPVRHNLDVMHVERNVAASIVSTLLHCRKSKDGINARKDLQLLGIRKDLHPQAREKEPIFLQLLGLCPKQKRKYSVSAYLTSEVQMATVQIFPGPNAVKVLIESATKPEAFLWRPVPEMSTIEDVVGEMIAWDADLCIVPTEGVIAEDIAPKSPSTSSKNRCKLMALGKNDEVIAKGRWQSREPKALVNGLPLGPNAIKVYVDSVLNPKTWLWRPTVDMRIVQDSLNCFVAWPANRVVIETTTNESPVLQQSTSKAASTRSHNEMSPVISKFPRIQVSSTNSGSSSSQNDKSPETPKAPLKKLLIKTKPSLTEASPRCKSQRLAFKANQKCKLMDISGKKCVVAEGRWSSNNPDQVVHHIPLGPNACRVWVDVVIVKDAAVWKQSSEIEYMEDALGSSIAWPEEKIVME